MTIQEIQQYMMQLHQAINHRFGRKSKSESMLLCLTKLTEEVGELAEQVMKQHGRQDERKGSFEQEDLEDEMVDVIIATMMMATELEIDMTQVMKRKMQQIADKRNI